MKKIAIDIVLIPPPSIAQQAIAMNRGLADTAAANYILNAKTCVPHITVLMGLIEREALPKLYDQLSIVMQQTQPLPLELTGVYIATLPDGNNVSSLVVKKELALQQFHESILNDARFLLSHDAVTAEMFYEDPPVNEFAVSWVSKFMQTSVHGNYQPHITLGIGKASPLAHPIHFTVSQLAVCHLGNYCTCRDILWSTKLE